MIPDARCLSKNQLILNFERYRVAQFEINYYKMVLVHQRMPSSPVDTRRRFNVDTMSYGIIRRRIDVETTSCVYEDIDLEINF